MKSGNTLRAPIQAAPEAHPTGSLKSDVNQKIPILAQLEGLFSFLYRLRPKGAELKPQRGFELLPHLMVKKPALKNVAELSITGKVQAEHNRRSI